MSRYERLLRAAQRIADRVEPDDYVNPGHDPEYMAFRRALDEGERVRVPPGVPIGNAGLVAIEALRTLNDERGDGWGARRRAAISAEIKLRGGFFFTTDGPDGPETHERVTWAGAAAMWRRFTTGDLMHDVDSVGPIETVEAGRGI